ncbi:hypothetical protein Tco_1059631 [Tanacetum coccineum]
MVEPEPVKKISKKELLRLDEELAFKLQAKEEEEERLAREKAQQVEEANIAWDDVQAKIDADYQLAQRLQAQEQDELTDEEKARLFVQFLEQRRKHFAAKRAEEKRNRPPTRAQQRSIMCTYLKNMEGWKPKSLKNKSFANIQELFDKAMKRVNTFVDYRTELVHSLMVLHVQKQVIVLVKLERRHNLSKIIFCYPLWTADLPFSQDPKIFCSTRSKDPNLQVIVRRRLMKIPRKDSESNNQEKDHKLTALQYGVVDVVRLWWPKASEVAATATVAVAMVVAVEDGGATGVRDGEGGCDGGCDGGSSC